MSKHTRTHAYTHNQMTTLNSSLKLKTSKLNHWISSWGQITIIITITTIITVTVWGCTDIGTWYWYRYQYLIQVPKTQRQSVLHVQQTEIVQQIFFFFTLFPVELLCFIIIMGCCVPPYTMEESQHINILMVVCLMQERNWLVSNLTLSHKQ